MKLKTTKIIFWITTTAIFLFEGVMPALFSQKPESIAPIVHLGYPIYFIKILTTFKILGTLALIIPQIPKRIKEWAYAGFAFDFICASLSYLNVEGFGFFAMFPLIVFAVLIVSYVCYHKMIENQK